MNQSNLTMSNPNPMLVVDGEAVTFKSLDTILTRARNAMLPRSPNTVDDALATISELQNNDLMSFYMGNTSFEH